MWIKLKIVCLKNYWKVPFSTIHPFYRKEWDVVSEHKEVVLQRNSEDIRNTESWLSLKPVSHK